MPARRLSIFIAIVLAMALGSGVARAQQPTLVNKSAVVFQGTEVKDENGKAMRLKRGEAVTVIYERTDWYWVKNRKGQQGWVGKKFIKVKDGGEETEKVDKPEKEKVEKAEVKPKVTKKNKGKKGKEKEAEEAKTETKVEEAKTETKVEEAKTETKVEEAKTATKVEEAKPETKTEMIVATNTPDLSSVAAVAPAMSSKRPGVIDVVASETGARVSVDGRDVGLAPLRGVQVKGGNHMVSVEKPGFLPSNAQVEVDGGAAQLALALVPTTKTRDDYEGGSWLWRIVGYTGIGLGAGAALAGLGVGGWGLTEAGTVRKDIDNYNRSENRTDSERTDLVARRDGAQLKFLIGEISLISGLALAVVGVAAYMLSGDPDRYAAYPVTK